MTVSIFLTADQVASVKAQDTTSPPGPGPTPPPPPPPVVVPPPVTTPGNVRIIDLNWARPERIYTGDFGGDDVIAVRFTTGNIPSSFITMPHIVGVEYASGAQQTREANFSDTAGTMAADATLNGVPLSRVPGITATEGSTITLYFTIAPDANGWYPQFKTNTTYYVNVKNKPGFSGQMSFDLLKGAL